MRLKFNKPLTEVEQRTLDLYNEFQASHFRNTLIFAKYGNKYGEEQLHKDFDDIFSMLKTIREYEFALNNFGKQLHNFGEQIKKPHEGQDNSRVTLDNCGGTQKSSNMFASILKKIKSYLLTRRTK